EEAVKDNEVLKEKDYVPEKGNDIEKVVELGGKKKVQIALNEYPEDSDLKMILGKRLGFFKELYRRDVDNAMVVLHKDNDLSEEAVKDNKVLKEKDDVPEIGMMLRRWLSLETSKEKDVEKVVVQHLDKTEAVKDNKVSNEIYDVREKGKDVEKVVELGGIKTVLKVVDQDLDKHEDIEKEREIGNNEVEKKIEDLIKGARADVCVKISKKRVSKGVLAIYEEPLKDSELQTSIFDSQLEDSQLETQDSQPGMEIGTGIQEENHEPVKNCETLKEADFPSIGLEDIESLKGAGRNLFDEKTTVQHVNKDDMILQDSLLNLPFLSTQEVSCLEIDTQKSPQIQKQEVIIIESDTSTEVVDTSSNDTETSTKAVETSSDDTRKKQKAVQKVTSKSITSSKSKISKCSAFKKYVSAQSFGIYKCLVMHFAYGKELFNLLVLQSAI
ncbi:hypothetical protein Tco_0689993, partial [Tanacetum coccineum]